MDSGRGEARPVRVAGFLARVFLLLAIFAGVGVWAARYVVAREVAHGQPEYAIRLASYMTGLFAGGVVTTLALVVMLLLDRRATRGGQSGSV